MMNENLNNRKKQIYLDYAATTPVDPRVFKTMLPYFSKKFGNTSSVHRFGIEAQKVLDEQRKIVAETIKAEPEEIIFTSSATESNNLALKGVAFANGHKGKHIIISQIEHISVLETVNWLEKEGFQITRLKPDQYGFISPNQVKAAITKKTILVSIIHASNEIGTIQPITEIGKICQEKNVYFHTDAVQSFGKELIDVNEMKIDLLTTSSHKLYGPKGAACLFIKQGTKIIPIIHGGGHEFGLRSSTVNLPAIVGFAKAIQLCQVELEAENNRLLGFRNKIIQTTLKQIPRSYLNGHPTKRLVNNINLRFDFIEGEALVMLLDLAGIAVSTGSACSSHKLKPNDVLLAIGLKPSEIHGSLRISLGRWTTAQDISYFIQVLSDSVIKLRKISPLKL